MTWQEHARYPLSSLVEASGLSEAALGRAVGLSGSTLKKAREHGFTESAADRYAIRLELHPSEVWPGFGLATCEACSGSYPPSSPTQLYCSPRCRYRVAARRRRQDPAYRAARAEYMRVYRQDASRAIAANKRRWIEANLDRHRAATREATRRWRSRRDLHPVESQVNRGEVAV
jgi:lambda repressor-like predicted transcriptional regulator